jgi:hypothetical protein
MNVPKFRNGETIEIQNIVADLSIKRIRYSLIVLNQRVKVEVV